MLSKILVLVALAIMSLSCFSGCRKSSNEAEPQPKTTTEYEAEAQEEIKKENFDQELENLEKEIEQDISLEE